MNRTLEHILPRVQKPARYTGGEYNAVVKDRREVDVRYALCFPDTYEIGMSNLGPILHHRIIFSASVTGGLLYFWQNTLQCPVHDVPPGNSHFECRNHFTRF